MEITNFIDPFWTEAAQSVQLEAGETLLAPIEFRKFFDPVWPYKASFAFQPQDFGNIVIHKGRLDELNDRFLQRALRTHQPVLANDVFVVLSTHAIQATHKSSAEGDEGDVVDAAESSHYKAFVSDVQEMSFSRMHQDNTGGQQTTAYFVHLPRTGGTSLRRQLVKIYKSQDIFPAQQYEELSRWDEFYASEHGPLVPRLVGSYKLFGGHLGGWFVDRVLGFEVSAFTMLRDPVEQMVSYYQYYLQSVLPAHQQEIESNPESFQDLESFVRSPFAPFNQQARVLGYDPGPNPDLATLAQENLSSLGGIFPPFEAAEEAERLESAKRRLQSCEVVGVTPRRVEFFQKLKEVYGWELDAGVNINISDRQKYKSVELAPGLQQFIKEKQHLDYELYEMALDMSP